MNDGSYEKIHMDKLGWLIQDKIITLTNPDIAYEHREYKDIDPSILIVYLRAIKDESYPCSHKTITKIIDRYSILYGKPYCVSTLYKKYRIWANSGYDNSVISRSFASKRQSKFSDEVIDLVDHVIYEEYLTRDKNSIAEVYQKYIEAHLDKFQNEYYVSRSSFYQIINNLSAYEVCCAREGKKIADAKFRKITSFYVPNFPLEVVEIDALHINYSVLNEQRNIVLGTILIYIAIDRYSRAPPLAG